MIPSCGSSVIFSTIESMKIIRNEKKVIIHVIISIDFSEMSQYIYNKKLYMYYTVLPKYGL